MPDILQFVKFVAKDDRAIAVKTQIPMLNADQYRKFDSGILQTELADLVDEIGPGLPLLTIRDEFIRRFGQKWSANSVFPTLKSTAYFSRMAPGIMGYPAYDRRPGKTDNARLSPDSITSENLYTGKTIQKSNHVSSVESRGRISIVRMGRWKSAVETVCFTAVRCQPRMHGPFRKTKKQSGKRGLIAMGTSQFQSLRFSSPIPFQVSGTFFTLATFASNYSTISWMDINRVLGNRIDSRSSLSYVAILSLIGILHLPKNWLLPLEVNTRAAYRFMNELVCNDRLQGFLARTFPSSLNPVLI